MACNGSNQVQNMFIIISDLKFPSGKKIVDFFSTTSKKQIPIRIYLILYSLAFVLHNVRFETLHSVYIIGLLFCYILKQMQNILKFWTSRLVQVIFKYCCEILHESVVKLSNFMSPDIQNENFL